MNNPVILILCNLTDSIKHSDGFELLFGENESFFYLTEENCADNKTDYYENSDMIEVSNSKQEYLNEVKRMQSDIYNIMKQSIYDKLDGSMSYSYVQNSMDNAERQIKTRIPTFDISLDLSSGTMFPKWICSVRLNDGNTYRLMYISVDLNSSYRHSHKYIGTYNIG